MKAMVLAAGQGTRLHPITDSRPKALVPLAGRPMIEYALLWLRYYGIGEIIINLHHFGEQIEDRLGDVSNWFKHHVLERKRASRYRRRASGQSIPARRQFYRDQYRRAHRFEFGRSDRVSQKQERRRDAGASSRRKRRAIRFDGSTSTAASAVSFRPGRRSDRRDRSER